MNLENIKLPEIFNNEIIYFDEESQEITIRSNVKTIVDYKLWIKHFSERTRTTWRNKDIRLERKTTDCGRKKVFQCNYKSAKCSATISFSSKDKSKDKSTDNRSRFHEDVYDRAGLSSTIKLDLNHCHPVFSCYKLSTPKYHTQTLMEFRNYFVEGFDSRTALKFHEKKYLFQPDDASNIEIPDYFTVLNWYRSWSHEGVNRKMHFEAVRKLKMKLPSYADAGNLVFLSFKPFAISVVTAGMLKAHDVMCNIKAIFVENIRSDDKHYYISFLLAYCTAGVMPIGVIITKNQSYKNYLVSFQLLRTAFNHGGVTDQRNYKFFIDNNMEQKQALECVWPDSKIMVNRRWVAQSFWNDLFKISCNIEKDLRPLIFNTFMNMLLSPNVDDAENHFNLFAFEGYGGFAKHLNPSAVWLERIKGYWLIKERWCAAFQEEWAEFQDNDFANISARLFMMNYVVYHTKLDFVGMLDYICFSLDSKFNEQLKLYVGDYRDNPRTYLLKVMKKHSFLDKSTIQDCRNYLYAVPNRCTKGTPHYIHLLFKYCSCMYGRMSIFCKHLCSFFCTYPHFLPEMPSCSGYERYLLAAQILGNNAPSASLYQYFIGNQIAGCKQLEVDSNQHQSGSDENNESEEFEFIVQLDKFKYYVQK